MFMNSLAEDSATQTDPKFHELTEKLRNWLDTEDEDFVKLRRWLTGYEIPALGREREPYGWILEGLHLLNNKIYFQKIAKKAASFLKQVSSLQYLTEAEKYDEEFIYNLFYLCAVLNQKEILAEPLKEKYLYYKENILECERIFTGAVYYNISDSFREALLNNQIDETYYEVWNDILEENESAFLFTYTAYDGFRGVNLMPSLIDPSIPNIDAIGKALKQMTDYLEDLPESGRKLRGLIERIQEAWGSYPHLQKEIYEQAIEHSFPSWATNEIFTPPVQIESKDVESTRYNVWIYISTALEEIDDDLKVTSQNDFIMTIEIPNDSQNTIYFLNGILERVEIIRQQTSKESFPFQIKAIANEILNFKDLLHARGKYKFSEVVFHIYKKLRKFHQRKEFQHQIEFVYKLLDKST